MYLGWLVIVLEESSRELLSILCSNQDNQCEDETSQNPSFSRRIRLFGWHPISVIPLSLSVKAYYRKRRRKKRDDIVMLTQDTPDANLC
jgi:hypothetical protein